MTPEGVIYSREAILEYFLKQKKMLRKKLAAWEAQQQEGATKVCPLAPSLPRGGQHCLSCQPCAPERAPTEPHLCVPLAASREGGHCGGGAPDLL